MRKLLGVFLGLTAAGCSGGSDTQVDDRHDWQQRRLEYSTEVSCGGAKLAETTLERGRGRPTEWSAALPFQHVVTTVCVELTNVGDGNASAFWLTLDGAPVVGPNAFNRQVERVTARVNLPAGTSILGARLASTPGVAVQVRVYETALDRHAVRIDEGGGIVELDGVTVRVPPGAVPEPTDISVQSVRPVGSTSPGPTVVLEPSGLEFAVPIEIDVPLDRGRIPAGAEPQLVAYVDWEPQPAVFAPDFSQVRVQVPHFSTLLVHYLGADPQSMLVLRLLGVASDITEGVTRLDFSKEHNPFVMHLVDLNREDLRVRVLTGQEENGVYPLLSLGGLVAASGLSDSLIAGINGPIFGDPVGGMAPLHYTVVADGDPRRVYQANRERRLEVRADDQGSEAVMLSYEPLAGIPASYREPGIDVVGSRTVALRNRQVEGPSGIVEGFGEGFKDHLKRLVRTSRTAVGIDSLNNRLVLFVSGGNDVEDNLIRYAAAVGEGLASYIPDLDWHGCDDWAFWNCNFVDAHWDSLDDWTEVSRRYQYLVDGTIGFGQRDVGALMKQVGCTDAILLDSASSSVGLDTLGPINLQLQTNAEACGVPEGCSVPSMLAVVRRAAPGDPPPPGGGCPAGEGAYCGDAGRGQDPERLYWCNGGAWTLYRDCASGCTVRPPGVPDVCSPLLDVCPHGDGLYCGTSDPRLPRAETLYQCEGGAFWSIQACEECAEQAPGVNDRCARVAAGAPAGSCGGRLACPLDPVLDSPRGFGVPIAGRGLHLGVDLPADRGQQVYAVCDGPVVYSGLHQGYASARDYTLRGPLVLQQCNADGEDVVVLYGHCALAGELGPRAVGEPVCRISFYEGPQAGQDWSHLHWGARLGVYQAARLGDFIAGYAAAVGAWVNPQTW